MKYARIATARARVELALPAAIAHRLTGIFRPTTDDDRGFLSAAQTVFNAVILEPVEDLPAAKKESHVRNVVKVRDQLLNQYLGRGATTVYRAAHFWLQDLIDREILSPDPEGAFVKCWEALGGAFAQDRSNIEAWERCQRSAAKMADDWREWLAGRSYYVG